MRDRTPFVVGLLAIVAIVAWLLLRGEAAQPPEPASEAAATPPVRTTQAPALPPVLPAVKGPTADDTFSEQPREDAWAAKMEAELARRWKQIRGGTLERTDCRRSQCRLIVTGTQDALASAIADLEGPRGLHGFAENVLLSSPSVAADGTVTLRIYVRFEN